MTADGKASAIADAAINTPGVVALHAGPYGDVVTHLSGQRIVGVRLNETAVEVQLIVDVAYDLRSVGEQVRGHAERISGLPARVTIADVVEDGEGE
ncbi:hypothetical protein FOS14_23630 [Skermania sp. ID1734]|uniref:hypothetical protein n=1 Tax=Skermania sp. ID1734 TaxID=2597516 RepID=UPI001180FF13|nr:hypothetical protein [Skermania sp. ID1734]TSD93190.1 hypothetical protein FOS14_23630 [Skermania sp. ID1734]